MTTAKALVATLALRETSVAAGFSMVGLRHPALDPFLDVSLFSMSKPTFAPHPHAGFSAVTYMLPESAGAFVNRDSLGDRSRIAPGAVHWTQAGAGMLHEEIPEHDGVVCRGVQMFVKLPAALELLPPAAFHAEPHSIPSVANAGWSARVIAGSLGAARSPLIGPAQDVILFDVTAEPGAQVSLVVPSRLALWAMVMEGGVTHSGKHQAAPFAMFWSEDGDTAAFSVGPQQARILIGGGRPLREPFRFVGPFALSTDERLADARRRFEEGGMGRLQRSF
jgi:redox-sensitive bicupin YhaK (pirin superfamily)